MTGLFDIVMGMTSEDIETHEMPLDLVMPDDSDYTGLQNGTIIDCYASKENRDYHVIFYSMGDEERIRKTHDFRPDMTKEIRYRAYFDVENDFQKRLKRDQVASTKHEDDDYIINIFPYTIRDVPKGLLDEMYPDK